MLRPPRKFGPFPPLEDTDVRAGRARRVLEQRRSSSGIAMTALEALPDATSDRPFMLKASANPADRPARPDALVVAGLP